MNNDLLHIDGKLVGNNQQSKMRTINYQIIMGITGLSQIQPFDN